MELRPLTERYYAAYRNAITRQLSRFGIEDEGLTGLIWFTLDAIVFKQLVLHGDVAPVVKRLRSIIQEAAA